MRIGIFHYNEPILRHLSSNLQSMGHEIQDIEATAKQPAAQVIQDIEKSNVDCFVFSNWDVLAHRPNGAQIEEALVNSRRPFVSWYLESPWTTLSPLLPERWDRKEIPNAALILTSDTYARDYFHERGARADYLPMGVDDRFIEKAEKESFNSAWAYPCIYSGSSFFDLNTPRPLFEEEVRDLFSCVILDRMKRDVIRYGKTSVEDADQGVRRWKPFLDALLRYDLLDWATYFKLRDAAIHRAETVTKTENWLSVSHILRSNIDVHYSFHLLARGLRELAPVGLRVFGSPQWKPLLSTFDHETPRLSDNELLQAYKSSSTVFCHTKHTFARFVHERVFQVLGAGGLPLTDWRDDLQHLFDPDEICAYRSFEEARELIKKYNEHPQERKALIEKGRRRVLEHHTYSRRSLQFAKLIQKHFGLGSTVSPRSQLASLEETHA